MAKSKRSNIKKHHRKIKAEAIAAAESERINKMSENLLSDASVRVAKIPAPAGSGAANLGMQSQLVRKYKKRMGIKDSKGKKKSKR